MHAYICCSFLFFSFLALSHLYFSLFSLFFALLHLFEHPSMSVVFVGSGNEPGHEARDPRLVGEVHGARGGAEAICHQTALMRMDVVMVLERTRIRGEREANDVACTVCVLLEY